MKESVTIKNLIDLGMNEREARLYVAMLRVSEATPSRLHQISGVPRTKTYETLDRMVSQGFCHERQEGRHKFYRATRPSEVCDMLHTSWDREFQMKCQLATDAFKALDTLYVDSSAADPSLEQIEVIRSKQQINLKFLSLIRETGSEVLSFTRSPYAASDAQTRNEVKSVQKEAFARGVQIRTVYMVETRDWPWLQSFIGDLEVAGEQVRLTEHLPMKMFISDRRRVLIALPSVPGLTGSDFTMLLVEDDGFAEACVVLFEQYWSQAHAVNTWLEAQGGQKPD